MGERVVVLGQGVVGLLLTGLLSRHPLQSLLTYEGFSKRREISKRMGAQEVLEPGDGAAPAELLLGPRRADLVYELSGNPAALDLATALAGNEGRVVVGSWYGQKRANVDLGGHFHRGRVSLVSSQVSHINPALSGRWDKPRRFQEAWKWLAALKPGQLVTHTFDIQDAAQAYDLLDKNPQDALGVLLTYK
jgi:threonine dehydrogenase-like Zn-dependent dehydrogenase